MTDNNETYKQFKIALSLEKSKKYHEAIIEYNKILNENPDYKAALINIGSVYSKLGDFDIALDFYDRAIKIKKDYLTFFNIGSVLYKKKEYKKAVIAFENSRKIKNNFPLTIQVLGLSYSHLDNYKAAITCFNQVLELDELNELALTALSILYYEAGKFNDALLHIERLEKLDSNSANIEKLKGNTLYNLNMLKESKDHFMTIKDKQKGYTAYNKFINSIPVESLNDRYGSIEAKIEKLKENTEKNPVSSPKDMVALSLCCLFKGDTDSAIEYLFKAKNKSDSLVENQQ